MDRAQNTNNVLTLIFGFAFGVFVSSFIFVSPLVSLLLVSIGIAILIAEKVLNNKVEREVVLISILIISFGFGVFRYAVKDFHEPLVPSPTGIVVSEPENKENTTRFVMRSDNGAKILASTDLYSSVKYGDRVEVNGELEEPGVISDGVGKSFDYAKYLAKDDIYFISNFAEVTVLAEGHGNPVKSFLLKVKQNLVSKIREILPEPESSLLAGLIVAGKTAMSKETLEEFQRSGVIHIVVLSGFNITLIAEFMRRSIIHLFLLTRIPASPRVAALASIIGVTLFVIMAGAEAALVRAAVMALTVVAAGLFQRSYSAPRALLVAGFVMLLENPKILVFDASFQLSFLATLGLIYVMPVLERLFAHGFLVRWHRLRETVTQTLATQLTVLPLLVYLMGNVSLVSLPANILILLIIPYTMLIGFIAALLAYVSPIIALPFSYVTHLALSWILGVAHFFGNLPFAVYEFK